MEQVGAVGVQSFFTIGCRWSNVGGGARRFGRLWRENVDSKKFSLPHTQSSESRPRRPFVRCVVGVGVGGESAVGLSSTVRAC